MLSDLNCMEKACVSHPTCSLDYQPTLRSVLLIHQLSTQQYRPQFHPQFRQQKVPKNHPDLADPLDSVVLYNTHINVEGYSYTTVDC